MRSSTIHLLAPALLLAAVGGAVTPARSQSVGETTAVNPASNGAGKTLVIGAQVVHNERIQTDQNGTVQILFLDRTTMNVGPNTSLVIDEFVYDPKSGVGKMAVKLVDGLMRVVGGQVTHSGEATITTPFAAIGLRGGTGQFAVTSKGTQAIFLGGNSPDAGLTVTPCHPSSGLQRGIGFCNTAPGGTDTQNVTAPGFGVIAGLGPVSSPAIVEIQTLAAQNALLSSHGVQTGGAAAGTASAAVTLSNTIAATVASKTINVNSTTTSGAANAALPAQQVTTITSPLNTVLRNAAQTVEQTATTTASQTTAQTVIQQMQQMPFAALPFALSMSDCCGSGNPTGTVPYLPSAYAFGGNYYVSPVLGYRPASTGTVANGTWFQYGINVTGEGAGQSSWFFVASGAFGSDGNGGLATSGSFGASRRAAANFAPGFAGGSLASLPNTTPQAGVQFDPATMLPTGGTIDNGNYSLNLQAYQTPVIANYSTGGNSSNPNTNTTYDFSQTFAAITPPAGLGSNRPNVTLNGYVGGLMQSFNSGSIVAPPFIVLNQNLSPTDVTIQLDADDNRVQANFNVARFSGSSANTFNTAAYQFGSVSTGEKSRGAYVDYNDFGGREAVSTTITSPTTETLSPISTVNGNPLASQNAEFVNVPQAVAQQIAAGISNSNVTFCQCEYTQWGFWSTADNYGSNGATSNLGNMLLWVTGQLPSAGQVPTTGSATYTGHAIANIANGAGNLPSQYIAAGNFTNTVNFANGTGNVSITNLDNTNYAGIVNLIPSSTSFVGALAGNTGNRAIALNGSFFKGAASPVGEMGGQIAITGTNYLGAGIFAAKMQ